MGGDTLNLEEATNAALRLVSEYMRQWGESLQRSIIASLTYIRESARDVAEGRLMRIPLVEASSFPGALYILTYREGRDEAEVMEAVNHLIADYFIRGAVFHPERWRFLEEHFETFRKGEGVGFETAWHELASPALFEASHPLPRKPEYLRLSLIEYLKDIYRHLRCGVRRGIECALLDGVTLDEYLRRGEQPWPEEPEEDTPEALALEARIAEEMRDHAETHLDVVRALALAALTPKELEAVSTKGGDDAMRARRYRAMKKLKRC